MKIIKPLGHSLLCHHIIEPFRAPRSSWKNKSTRVWCAVVTAMDLSISWCLSYAIYLAFFDGLSIISGGAPSGFSSFGLFSIESNYELAVNHHLKALITTILMPIHRLAYDAYTTFIRGGMVTTYEDAWPCEPEEG